MPGVTAPQLNAYRALTYRSTPALRLKSPSQALDFVNERGFVYFWPIQGVEMPSLWTAVAGNRPVADAHDDPGHVTWGWKDQLLGARQWYYAKVLRGRATMISFKALPYFYALSENYGDAAHDYVSQYEEGRMTQAAKAVFEALLARGRLDTLALRREARMTGKDSNTRFEHALVELQMGLKILPVGVAEAGAWRYAFIYELVDRYFPDLAERARHIGRGEARAQLADLYLKSVGAAAEAGLARLFRWKPDEVRRACEALVSRRKARRMAMVAGRRDDWLVTARLLKK
jgi:hypothetical protein